LKIEHRVRNVSLAKKGLLWIQLDDCSAESGVCKKGCGIELIVVIARQIVASLKAHC
jgi:hypothetical protein